MARRKAPDDLDLTPFIGLFAMLVVLLLLTASWSKIYSFKTKFSSSQSAAVSPPNDVEEDKKKDVELEIKALRSELIFIEKGEKNKEYKVETSRVLSSSQIDKIINRWKDSFGEDKQITIESEALFKYGTMITLYDRIYGLGMHKIAISTEEMEEL
jgi:biopolymer transport protein ExbD